MAKVSKSMLNRSDLAKRDAKDCGVGCLSPSLPRDVKIHKNSEYRNSIQIYHNRMYIIVDGCPDSEPCPAKCIRKNVQCVKIC